VCESITPAPVTECTLDEILAAWQVGPIIWGGIPSSILEPQTTEEAFVAQIDQMFRTIAGQPIILGIGDLVMPGASPERIRYIADRVAEFHAHIAR
jgi:hypothetical protein